MLSSVSLISCSRRSTLCLASSGCRRSRRRASSSIRCSSSSNRESTCFISRCTFSAKRCKRSNLLISSRIAWSRSWWAIISRFQFLSSTSICSSGSISTSPTASKYLSNSRKICVSLCLSFCRGGTSSVRKRLDSAASFFISISVFGKVRSNMKDNFSLIHKCKELAMSRYSALRCCDSGS